MDALNGQLDRILELMLTHSEFLSKQQLELQSITKHMKELEQRVAGLDRQQRALGLDFHAVHQACLQISREVIFFTNRCEDRGNRIRDILGQVRDGEHSEATEAAAEFMRALECSGTPVEGMKKTVSSEFLAIKTPKK
jgi:hypothetical protein